jgi:hypothetical protein
MSDDPSSSTPSPTPGAPTTLRMRPISVSQPFRLTLDYQNVTFKDIDLHLSNFTLQSSPNAQLQIPQSVSRLVGNGGIQLLNQTLPQVGPFIIRGAITATGHWADSQGLVLDSKFNGDISALLFNGVRMRLDGQFNFHWAPATATGTIDWATGLRLEFDLDVLSGLRRR